MSMNEIDMRLAKVEEMFKRMDVFVSAVVKDARQCKLELKNHKKEIKQMKKVVQKIYLHNIKIIKRCPEVKAIE